jgi:hypothetical protein
VREGELVSFVRGSESSAGSGFVIVELVVGLTFCLVEQGIEGGLSVVVRLDSERGGLLWTLYWAFL